jgi:hypothetical protein
MSTVAFVVSEVVYHWEAEAADMKFRTVGPSAS